MGQRLRFVRLARKPEEDLCRAVFDGLRRPDKRLPSRFFYDHAGSALFERITELPEYYLTRAETQILETNGEDILDAIGSEVSLVEFGSGSSRKTRRLIERILRRQPRLSYVPIDISERFLRESASALLEDWEGLEVTALAGEYFEACTALPASEGPRLILFLGSNIGNFEPDEAVRFLTAVRTSMTPEDRLLVETDLVKDREVLEAAYNDSHGVTAQFNQNLLHRINHELSADFAPQEFEHHAPYDEASGRVEMKLVSRRQQRIHVEDLGLDVGFHAGEAIHTEWSHKYTAESFGALAQRAGLLVAGRWTDSRDWYAVNLLARA